MSVLKKLSPVIKSVIICCLLTYSLTGFNLAMSQTETANDEPSNRLTLPGIGGVQNNQTRYNFTAEEYFYPIKPDAVRDHLPERLTFEVVRDMDLEEIKSRLESSKWKVVFHCQGRAIPVEEFMTSSIMDGVVNPMAITEFNLNSTGGAWNQTVYAPEINPENWHNLHQYNRTFVIEDIEISGEGSIKLNIENGNDQFFEIIKVRETGEILIQGKSESTRNAICPDGTRPRYLWVQFNENLMS